MNTLLDLEWAHSLFEMKRDFLVSTSFLSNPSLIQSIPSYFPPEAVVLSLPQSTRSLPACPARWGNGFRSTQIWERNEFRRTQIWGRNGFRCVLGAEWCCERRDLGQWWLCKKEKNGKFMILYNLKRCGHLVKWRAHLEFPTCIHVFISNLYN